jgi:NADH-quinone oxidoreductase subunit L
MTAPLIVLALGSALMGWPHHAFAHYLAPAFPREEGLQLERETGWILMILAISAALLGMFLARHQIVGRIQALLYNKWYVDEIYGAVFVNGLCKRGGRLLSAFDRHIVDGGVNGTAWLTRANSRLMIFWDTWVVDGLVRLSSFVVLMTSYPARLLQTGHVQTYALFVVLGMLAMFGIYLTRS